MSPRASLNVSLTPELTAYIADQVGSGRLPERIGSGQGQPAPAAA